MTKADIVREIATQTGLEKQVVLQVVEGFMDSVKSSMINGEEVYLRGFGSVIQMILLLYTGQRGWYCPIGTGNGRCLKGIRGWCCH